MNHEFNSREELLKLLETHKWVQRGDIKEGHWWGIVVFNPDGRKTKLDDPVKVTLFLDRNHDPNLHGIMYVHSTLNSYIIGEPK
jgi:hypothetical protein